VGGGVFKTVEALRVGDCIMVYDGNGLAPATLLALERISAHVRVYNLQTDEPHTFFASGAAVHNKGGGGGVVAVVVAVSAGAAVSTAAAARAGRRPIPVVVIVFLGIIVAFVVISMVRQHATANDEKP